MKRKRLIALMLTLIFIVAAFVGCTSQEDTTAPTGKTTLPAETTGGTVTSGREQLGYNPGKGMPDRIVPGTVLHASYLGQDFPQHLPWGASSRTDIYDTLFTPYQGDYSDIRGNLVTDWKFADDGLSITMQVKQGVTFTNGNPLNAKAICDVFTNCHSQRTPQNFAKIESMEATGEYEMVFKFSAPYPDFVSRFTTGGICDPKMIEEYGMDDNRAAIGTGPYYIESYSTGERLVLKANPNYHNPDKQPQIETVILYVIPNQETAIASFLNGDLTFMKTQRMVDLYAVQDAPNFDDDNIIIYPSPSQPFWFNMDHNPMLQNKKVREAIVKMIDWQAVCDLAYDGINTPLVSIFPEGTPLYVDSSSHYYCDPQEALQILQDEGIAPEDITFDILTNPNFVNVVLAVQEQLAKFGVTVVVNQVDVASQLALMREGQYDVTNSHLGYNPAISLSVFATTLTDRPVLPFMQFGNADPELHSQLLDLYFRASTALTDEKMMELLIELVTLIQENYAFMGGFRGYEFFFHTDNVKNITPIGLTGNPEFCWFYIED